jgi:hypothetical protein
MRWDRNPFFEEDVNCKLDKETPNATSAGGISFETRMSCSTLEPMASARSSYSATARRAGTT